MDGPAFKIDAPTVYQIILRNVHEDSDAYVYLKPLLRRQDGSLDIQALRGRYQSEASVQAIINNAKSVLCNLRYKNERSFSFERFTKQTCTCSSTTSQELINFSNATTNHKSRKIITKQTCTFPSTTSQDLINFANTTTNHKPRKKIQL